MAVRIVLLTRGIDTSGRGAAMRRVHLFLAVMGMLLINGVTGIAVWKSARRERQQLPSVPKNRDGNGDPVDKQKSIVSSSPSQEVWGRRSRWVQKANVSATRGRALERGRFAAFDRS